MYTSKVYTQTEEENFTHALACRSPRSRGGAVSRADSARLAGLSTQDSKHSSFLFALQPAGGEPAAHAVVWLFVTSVVKAL